MLIIDTVEGTYIRTHWDSEGKVNVKYNRCNQTFFCVSTVTLFGAKIRIKKLFLKISKLFKD